MEQSLDQETVANLRPLSVTNENSKIYAALKQCMANNEELRQALVEAAETIDKQTNMIEHLHECLNAGKTFKYY